jgi:hypothetical protein
MTIEVPSAVIGGCFGPDLNRAFTEGQANVRSTDSNLTLLLQQVGQAKVEAERLGKVPPWHTLRGWVKLARKASEAGGCDLEARWSDWQRKKRGERCKHGHVWTEASMVQFKRKDKAGRIYFSNECRICRKLAAKAADAKRKRKRGTTPRSRYTRAQYERAGRLFLNGGPNGLGNRITELVRQLFEAADKE